MLAKNLVFLCCVVLGIGISSSNCFAQLVVGTDNPATTSVSIQTPPGSGTFTALFSEDAQGLAWDGTQFHGSNSTEYWVAPLNGPTRIVNSFDFNGALQTITGLAYGNGTLFGIDATGAANDPSPEGIYTIDSMGRTTSVFDFTTTGFDSLTGIGGLAFNPLDGLLYGTSDDPDMRGLVSIDIANQSINLIAAYPNNEDDIDGLAIGDGIAYLIDDDNTSPGPGGIGGLFYSYDLSQGTNGTFDSFPAPWNSSELFSSGAFITAVPEPNCYAILMGVGLFMAKRRKR